MAGVTPCRLLRGPDPEQFRVTVRGARYYHDPLGPDDQWPKWDEKVPSVTTVKRSWSKPFRKKTSTGATVPLDAFWAAEYAVDHLDVLVGADREDALMLVATAPQRSLTRAGDRGTSVHGYLEALAEGRQIDSSDLPEDVRPFAPACQQFVEDFKPTWLMTEVVVINRSLGYGGTFDAAAQIPGLGLALIDWKTRGSNHGAYGEEAAQLGGYAGANYCVVVDLDTGELKRVPVPAFDLGLVVSLTADDGYEVFPVDLEVAFRAFLAMRETWELRHDGEPEARRAIGAPITAQDTVVLAERIEWVRARVKALPPKTAADLARGWPDGVPRKVRDLTTNEQVDLVAAALNTVEAAHRLPFHTGDPAVAPTRPSVHKRTQHTRRGHA